MSSIPKTLYKFRSWTVVIREESEGRFVKKNYTKELLEQGILFCSSPYDYDDPHDNQLGAHATGGNLDIDRFLFNDMSGIREVMRKYNLSSMTQLSSLMDNPDVKKIMSRTAGQRERRNSRVLCLADTWNNEIMWALYADNHKGVCFGFDTQHEFFQQARRVDYMATPAEPFAFSKSKAWEFQKEWRIVLPGPEPKKVCFPKESLTEVYVGYRCPERMLNELKTVLIANQYRVNFHRVEIMPRSFEFFAQNLGRIG